MKVLEEVLGYDTDCEAALNFVVVLYIPSPHVEDILSNSAQVAILYFVYR